MKKMKSISLILLIATLSSVFFACNKEKPMEYSYTSNTIFGFDKIQDVGDYNGATLINVGENFSTENAGIFLVAEQKYVIIKSDNNKYGVYDYNGKKIYDTIYDFIDYSYNSLRLYKDGIWTIKNYANGKEATFNNGIPVPLYNNIIAFFCNTPEYKIEIMNYNKDIYFSIFDSSRDKLFEDSQKNPFASNKLINYGNFIVYKNDQFKTFTAYDIKGTEVLTIPSYSTSTFYYLGGTKFLHNFTSTTEIWTHRSLLYDVSSNSSYKEVFTDSPIASVYSKAANNCALADGFRLAVTIDGNSYIVNGDIDEKGELRYKSIPSLPPYAREQNEKIVCIDKDNKDKLHIYDAAGNPLSTISSIHSPVFNDGYVVGGVPKDNYLAYGVYTTDGKRIVDNSYEYLAPIVKGVTFGYKTDEAGLKTFYRISLSGETAVETVTTINNISSATTGVYFSFEKGVLVAYSFKGKKLFELEGVNTYSYYTVSDNKAMIIRITKGNEVVFAIIQ